MRGVLKFDMEKTKSVTIYVRFEQIVCPYSNYMCVRYEQIVTPYSNYICEV